MNLANFRELGGLANREGKRVRSKRLLRSGELYQLNEKSKETLEVYELVKVIDLRGEQELSQRPDDQLPQVAYHWIDIMKEVQKSGSLEDLTTVGDPAAVDQHMLEIYDHLILNTGAQQGYREYFQELLQTENGSVLFHCFAGKDRTGIAAALTLELLDVSKEVIYQDYLQTNIQRQAPNQLLFDVMIEKGANQQQIDSMRVALEVKASYLDRSYQLIAEHFGDVHGYAKEILGFSPSDIQDLQKLYLD